MTTEPEGSRAPKSRPDFPWDYFALAFAFSWSFWGLAYLMMRGRPTVEGNTEALLESAPPAMLVLVLVGVFGPFFGAFVLTAKREGRDGVSALWKSGWSFKLPLPWLLVALFLFPAVRIASLLASGAGVSFEIFTRPLTLIGLTLFMYFLGGSFGEEFGWRGYALPRLLERQSALGASLVLGLIWVAWHLPLFFIPGSPQALQAFLTSLDKTVRLKPSEPVDQERRQRFQKRNAGLVNEAARQQRLVHQLDRHNQALLAESPYVRNKRFWDKLDYSSPEKFERSVELFRKEFREEVIGAFHEQPLPFNPRTRKAYDEQHWVGYEVMLDLWPDVFCYGILCLPKDLKRDGSERRPVVVCQHGLEGRPQDVVAGGHRAYHDFAAKLCERGFITFAPQNLYIGGDRFRTLQRKANPLGKTLFSIITPQHQQMVDWLKTQPFADGQRIGFYGLSYGGKTAMRVPPLVPDYKCVICSADFNDWVWK